MKNFFALLLLSLMLVACGSNTSAPVAGGPVAPQPSAYGTWDANTVAAFNQYCSEAGGQGFSPQQWYGYCDCIAKFAGAHWTIEDFAQNLDNYYDNVILAPGPNGQSPDNVCLSAAGMGSNNYHPQTQGAVRTAEML